MVDNILYLIIIFILLFCSSYFSACETAITAYSRPRMFRMAKEGDKKAKIIIELQQSIGLVISTILTCNTILNSLVSAFMTIILIELLGSYAVVFAPIFVSILLVLFAEVLPKMLAISNPEKILIPSAYFIKFLFVVLTPVNRTFGYIAKKFITILRLSGKDGEQSISSIEELKGAIDLHKASNLEDTDQEKEMLKSILDLGSVPVSNIMVHRKNVTMLCANDDINSLIVQIMNCPFTRIPLWKDNQENIIAVLHVKDLLKELRNNKSIEDIDIAAIARKPWFIPENKDLLDQLQSFKNKHEHFAVVVDEYGSFMGIITLEDVIEEIVGDISDEHDIASTSGIRMQDDGSCIVDGSINIRDLNRELNTNFKDDTAATIAGFIINSVGIIPEAGQIFILSKHKFEILKKQRNQITLIRMSKVGDNDEDQ